MEADLKMCLNSTEFSTAFEYFFNPCKIIIGVTAELFKNIKTD